MKYLYILLAITLLCFSCNNETPTAVDKTGHEKPMDEALQSINKKIQSDTSNPSLYVERAQYYLQKSQINEALTSLQKAVDIDSLNFIAWDNLADIYLMMGNMLDCEAALFRLQSLDPNNTATFDKLAKYSLIIKDYDESKRYAHKAISLNPKDAQAYYVLGAINVEQGDTGIAIKNLITSTELDPNFYDSQLHLAIIYETRSNPLAAEYYKNAIRIRPNHLPTQYSLGMFYQENLHQLEKALTVYNTILQQDSVYVKAIYNIGYIYLVYSQDPKKALHYFEKAVKFQPNYTEALYNAGLCHELMNQKDAAKGYYEESLQINPDFQLAIKQLNSL